MTFAPEEAQFRPLSGPLHGAIYFSVSKLMHYLLFIGAFLFFAFIAPLKVTFAACAMLLIVTTIIRFTARAVAGVDSSYNEAAKAVGLSFFFLVIAFFVLLSFSKGTGVTHFTGLAGYLVFAAFLVAYVLGFKLSLGLSFGSSAVIAACRHSRQLHSLLASGAWPECAPMVRRLNIRPLDIQ